MPRRLRPLADVIGAEPDPGQRAAAWALAGRAALSNTWPVPDPFTGRRSWLILAVTLLVGVWVWLGAATVTEQVTPLDGEPAVGVVSDRDSRVERDRRGSYRECRLQVSYQASGLPGRTWSHYSKAACDLATGDQIPVQVSRSDPHDARVVVPGQGWLLPVAAAWTLLWTPALGALLWLSLRCWWWGRRWLTLAEGADPQHVSPGLRGRLQDAWEPPGREGPG